MSLEVLEVTFFGRLLEGPEPHSILVGVVGLGQPCSVRPNPLFLTNILFHPSAADYSVVPKVDNINVAVGGNAFQASSNVDVAGCCYCPGCFTSLSLSLAISLSDDDSDLV